MLQCQWHSARLLQLCQPDAAAEFEMVAEIDLELEAEFELLPQFETIEIGKRGKLKLASHFAVMSLPTSKLQRRGYLVVPRGLVAQPSRSVTTLQRVRLSLVELQAAGSLREIQRRTGHSRPRVPAFFSMVPLPPPANPSAGNFQIGKPKAGRVPGQTLWIFRCHNSLETSRSFVRGRKQFKQTIYAHQFHDRGRRGGDCRQF